MCSVRDRFYDGLSAFPGRINGFKDVASAAGRSRSVSYKLIVRLFVCSRPRVEVDPEGTFRGRDAVQTGINLVVVVVN